LVVLLRKMRRWSIKENEYSTDEMAESTRGSFFLPTNKTRKC
jgi:hypothetical protein